MIAAVNPGCVGHGMGWDRHGRGSEVSQGASRTPNNGSESTDVHNVPRISMTSYNAQRFSWTPEAVIFIHIQERVRLHLKICPPRQIYMGEVLLPTTF